MSANETDDGDQYAAPYREPRPCPDAMWDIRPVPEREYAAVYPVDDFTGIEDAIVFLSVEHEQLSKGDRTEWIAAETDHVDELEDRV